MGDYKQALEYGKKAMEYEAYSSTGKMVVSGNFGDLYERMNKMDSALVLCEQFLPRGHETARRIVLWQGLYS